MNLRNTSDSPVNRRGGQVSYLLLNKDLGSQNLAITWVDCEPGSRQKDHRHDEQEQVYVIVRGRGLMRVRDEEEEVLEGTMVFVPPGHDHSILNTGTDTLTYVSATAPPFDLDSLTPYQRYEERR